LTTNAMDVAREILDYFVSHPQAADTFEGIARWRLREQAVSRNIQQTEQALCWLVDHVFLCEETTNAVGPVFHFDRARRAEAEAFLREGGSGSPSADGE
jgi:hypothetical protein